VSPAHQDDSARPVNVVNLTPHDVVVYTDNGQVRLPAETPSARVDERVLATAKRQTVDGPVLPFATVEVTGRVSNIPDPRADTIYLVSRLTAAATGPRPDLAVPFGEVRNNAGQVVGVRALAQLPGKLSWRQWVAVQLAVEKRRDWPPQLIAVLFAAATAFLGAALGFVPAAIQGEDNSRWTGVAYAALGLVALALGGAAWSGVRQVRKDRGTAYVVDEQSTDWTPQQVVQFQRLLESGFSEVLRVPGPTASRMPWALDLDRARQWAARFDKLMEGFWAVHFNDDPTTPNRLFVTAQFPVAIALGARGVGDMRGFRLSVRQRPTFGRGIALGPDKVAWNRGVHHFDGDLLDGPADLREVFPGARFECGSRLIKIAVEPDDALSAQPATILLVALTTTSWGPPTGALRVVADPKLELGLRSGSHELRELRLRYPPSTRQMPWSAYPAVVAEVERWLAQHREPDGLLLLGMLAPQEISVGLGMFGPGRYKGRWPEHLWPLVYDGPPDGTGRFVIPNFNIGAAGACRASAATPLRGS
jgi:hypothetical protein